MSKVLTDPVVPTFAPTVTVPEDAIDLRDAISVELPFQNNSDRAVYLKRQVDEANPHNWHQAVRAETTGTAILSASKKSVFSLSAGRYFIVGGIADTMYASDDGFDWGILDGTNGLGATVDIAAVADAGSAIVAVGDSDSYYRSVDFGVTWSTIVSPGGGVNTDMADAVRDTVNARTVLVGQDNAFAASAWTSTDGLIFTLVAMPITGQIPRKVEHGSGTVVAVPTGIAFATNDIYHSSDGGVTWGNYTVSFDNINDITYNAADNLWVITTSDGEVFTTSNPTTSSWVASTVPVLALDHIVTNDTIYLATAVSSGVSFVFYSKDATVSWRRYKLGAVFSDLGSGDGRFFGSLVAVAGVAGARMGFRKLLGGDLPG